MAQPPRFRREPPPAGIVYNTSMSTPDAALALGALWAFERTRRARVGGVCVTGGGFKSAVFCDIVNQYYKPGARHGNDALAVGLADVDDLPADQPMVAGPVDRVDSDGEPLYARTILRPTDTSLAIAQLRNAITFNAESSVILSAPATSLAGSLAILANRDLYSGPVTRLVLVGSRRLTEDADALASLLRDWPTPVVYLDAETAAAASLSSMALDDAFAAAVGARAHPVVDAYRAFREPPYTVPAADLLAMAFAVNPESSLFELSAPGRLELAGGVLRFTESAAGGVRRLRFTANATLREALLAAAATMPE